MDLEEAYNSFENKADKDYSQNEKEYINYSKSIATKIESLLINILSGANYSGGNPYVVDYTGKIRDVSSANYLEDISKYFNTYHDNTFINKDISIDFKSDYSNWFKWINFKYKDVKITINPDYTFDLYKSYGKGGL